jgi:succinate dehydrogenase/fumarate reductase flavoprotein subunit
MTSRETTHIETDVLVIGAGGAGMYAAIAAARDGARVLLVDRSLVGRSGATVMAQMTVAAAIGHATPDTPESHLADTLGAGRGLCDSVLAALICGEGPARILEMDEWGVGWARDGNRIAQAMAPGHAVPRCVYVDFLSTGPAVSRTLRTRLHRHDEIRRVSDLAIHDLATRDGRAVGAVGRSLADGAPVTVAAKATVIAAGGLTRLYRRNSASANMGGDGYALTLRAGAELVDMEFVQFFPIGHLAPRLIGMDPIMWDPFRYKLGGRLVNAEGREVTDLYGVAEDGKYVATRDVATYAILKEVAAGRGSPHGGAWLSFRHVPAADLRAAFGPVIDRLAANGIDLNETDIEVAPIAHYHMGGIAVDGSLATRLEGLYAAGEAVGGPSGANRLSGNAITEALVFGEIAGRSAATFAKRTSHAWNGAAAAAPLDRLLAPGRASDDAESPTALIAELQALMDRDVGPLRTGPGLERALTRIRAMRAGLDAMKPAAAGAFDQRLADWHDLDNMTLVAEAVALAALARRESRGAHQREDFPAIDPAEAVNRRLSLDGDAWAVTARAAT